MQKEQQKIIGLKDFRENLETYLAQIQKGNSFLVVKRSKPIFNVGPVEDGVEEWETVVDFTSIKKGGVNIKELLKRL
jgi:antitoxin (DNA-binding transcriptional repressor) of toxin-antitoxin stability system